MKRPLASGRARCLFVLLLFAIFALPSCASVPTARAQSQQPAETRIVIFHSNDIHGKIVNFAKVAAIIDAERKGGADVFYFCAGDNFTGNPVIDQYDPPGEPMLALLNRLGLNLMCPGNHDFDYGLENLRRFDARAHFSMVSANIEAPSGLLPQLQPSTVLTARNGIKIAVFGLIQIEAGNGLPSTHPDKIKGLRFSEPLAKALEMKKLRAGNDVLIGLTHIGYDQDLLLAGMMPELDAIIGGHSHTRVDPAETVNGVLVAQAGSDNRYLGRVELLIRSGRVVEKKGTLIDLKETLAEAADVKEMIVRFNQNPAFARVIAEAPQEIAGKEALGSMMTDAMRQVHGLDIAFQNGGGIRLNQLPKKITLKDILTLDPFGNQVVQFTLTVAEIRSLIAASFAKGNDIDLQVSGITYVVRGDRAGRISEIVLRAADGTPLAEDGKFQVGVSSYVASSYKFTHQDPGRSLQATTAEALIRYLQSGVDLGIYRDIHRAFYETTGAAPRN
ncbi:MAG: bifunctional UDP-sugar hydrolase/5'-nucleotidase [Candidatus Aminicenantes bacterium]|nr:bifunctional UDP-sugar hydrolase/5'-nucleotidase [Candidatus Aminicenantes bacterium]